VWKEVELRFLFHLAHLIDDSKKVTESRYRLGQALKVPEV
jgi:hypothetical protein